MKKVAFILLVVSGFFILGCATPERYNTQRGAAIGAGFGALAGQAIGRNTQSTLIGSGVGALLGSIIGNSVDQEYDEKRNRIQNRDNYNSEYYDNQKSQSYGNNDGTYYGNHHRNSGYGYREPPPGEWVTVPGHWQGRRWVPAHEVWRPIDPGYYR
ncbi:MAG: glycine zipper 2TM domain-containing protein [Proteobacteria bacterium]|nr:glycine zipper 2TM domain-containing protein [Pseudomonadota bacterium]MBU4469825.1 glycine zipper 2TM domain-containing protein [Pseudomonadota bacterium]MCG2753060.1 YMGG-like glycine zipper-containing protein [Desulfobacteraceae bacterium]